MSRVADLLARGVRITVGLPPGTPAEIPADFFELETRTPLRYDKAKQELISDAARLAYPVRDGVPIMLIDEARELGPDE